MNRNSQTLRPTTAAVEERKGPTAGEPVRAGDLLRAVERAVAAPAPARAGGPARGPRAERPRPARARPAHVVQDGPAVARVWATRGEDGVLRWRVDLARVAPPGDGRAGFSRTFSAADVPHALRALYLAGRWARKRERRGRRLPWWRRR